MTETDIKSMNAAELKEYVVSQGLPAYRAAQIYEWLHKKLVSDWDGMSNVPKTLREKLAENTKFTKLKTLACLSSEKDGTKKYLFGLGDGNAIESVFMKYKHGNSVCISSQVGCRMGCRFCASTLGGLIRNLTSAEMLEQIYEITRQCGERISNIVVMGSGEPFDNFDSLLKFIEMITDEHGLNISRRNITVSTCGLVPEIRRLADINPGITLAVSLHAYNDEKRKEIMPVANKYSIDEIKKACLYYFEKTGRRVSFEYSLISGVNDSEADAKELAKTLAGMGAHVNLIPVNPVKERDFKRSNIKNVLHFQQILEKYGINATIRRELGSDIDAACGQLRRSYEKGELEK